MKNRGTAPEQPGASHTRSGAEPVTAAGVDETRGNVEESQVMAELQQIEHEILAHGRVDGPELEVLRREVYAGGKIDREKADFLVALHKRVQHLTPAFERFFYQAIKDHILAH